MVFNICKYVILSFIFEHDIFRADFKIAFGGLNRTVAFQLDVLVEEGAFRDELGEGVVGEVVDEVKLRVLHEV